MLTELMQLLSHRHRPVATQPLNITEPPSEEVLSEEVLEPTTEHEL